MTQLPPEAIAALARGNFIEAIKITRDRSGMDLKSSKEAVERYANSVAGAQAQDAGWTYGQAEAGDAQGSRPAVVPPAALAALARGKKVEAVKITRDATGLGLAEAKRLVDAQLNPAAADIEHQPSNASANPMLEPGRVSSGGFKWLPFFIILLLAVLAWVFLGKGA
ncbi:ribosomal protein L7/L12 [Achromobacter sp. UMC71]|uniref:ribosomal protein L7/L12 n=1 Tax=Achromobacter sp. UMC71 TaxID=1862320 RepID=UPI0016009229|nr:ribosomal protein L7/L12 [Achromobacter sp. UMC71]MBB1624624.1 ribosomal protein L7/L12 [Achromobacter sp. UMC71]